MLLNEEYSCRMKCKIGRCIIFKRPSRRRMRYIHKLLLRQQLRPRYSPSRSGFFTKTPLLETYDCIDLEKPSISGCGFLSGSFHINSMIPEDLILIDKDGSERRANAPDIAGQTSSTRKDDSVDAIRRYLAQKLGLYEADSSDDGVPVEKVLGELTLDGVVEWMKGERCKNVITLAGAGISTSAGIPDFRSPVSGLYHNLQKYDLPEPQAIFEINFFRQNPRPFFALAKELFPGNFKPTACHYFVRLLHEKGLLLRHYTQNIDTLERGAGIPSEKLVEAHGTFYTSHCLECRKQYDLDFVKEHVFADTIPICTECPGVVKPDIVFFGESLPGRFQECLQEDFGKCDMLIIMGSSLEVQPFASLIEMVPDWCPRLLINRERAGQRSAILRMLGLAGGGLQLDESGTRDVAWLGDCDAGCALLAEGLGWGDELRELVAREHARLDLEGASNPHAPVIGPMPPGPATVGPSQVGPSNVGPSQVGPSNVGPSQVGPSNVGPNTGPTSPSKLDHHPDEPQT